MSTSSHYSYQPNGALTLHSPTALPLATGYLWNKRMLLNMSCRGFANAYFMQPEPANYSVGPALEAKTFMQPEHAYYTGHPGRFFYVRDEASKQCFSLPYEPMKRPLDKFEFNVETTKLSWRIEHLHWRFDLSVRLAVDDIVELWQLDVTNLGASERTISIYPCFNIGYQSWMNQGAEFDSGLNAIVGTKITPYQKLGDYEQVKTFNELSFLSADAAPDGWCANLNSFIGEGGWTQPDGLNDALLQSCVARYETPIAALQYCLTLAPAEQTHRRFLFGAAKTQRDIENARERYFAAQGFTNAEHAYLQYYQAQQSCIQIDTPDIEFDQFVNHWLGRQIYYHGDVNRLTTDPQTRNYLQDAMGMCFLNPEYFREALLRVLSQQHESGELPDGVLLHEGAELKYINQIPHADHAVWLPICLEVYLNETNDTALLRKPLAELGESAKGSVLELVELAMQWLKGNLDERGLSLIHQGDWCDPMNMVGHQGKGVSSWLSMATSYAWQSWSRILSLAGEAAAASEWLGKAQALNEAINKHFWAENWYARGITDAGRRFGTADDSEGAMFLNPQSWALMCNAASSQRIEPLLLQVKQHLYTPFGVAMLAPPYTSMVEDIGRITQKFPGVAENGSLYSHASAFFAFALYGQGQADNAFEVLKWLIPSQSDAERKGQLPNFVPNYYRGAHQLYPDHCGRSSRLFNTGTVAWMIRSIVEQLFGLKGENGGIRVCPQLPSEWPVASIKRRFGKCLISAHYQRSDDCNEMTLRVNGKPVQGDWLSPDMLREDIELMIQLPSPSASS